MKRIFSALAVAAAVFAGTTATHAAEEADTAAPLEVYGVRIGNPLDASTWWSGHESPHGGMEQLAINPIDPTFWIAFIDPKRHGQAHMTVMNPASMKQLMEVETYTNMMSMDVWAKWVALDTYAPLIDLQTYAYWMQPGAYTHFLDTAQFEPMLDVSNYTVVMHTAMDTAGLSEWVHAGVELAGFTPLH
ncbi:hypothetical protein RXV86_15320 [Alisedimentitalea sp. MJ-SS2]|uniref:hypothetical protein n=1 Tax=Aliisedimentitalea sp. MJ-SS2 TaxID=3049795 RepID=UPI002911232D|nr:hypothetical protein [Alisedimentitalea sp. MJ-SS2]MDU8928761.1 hypothetical protein [Alisedimentitalea sp. MJ-SS2]